MNIEKLAAANKLSGRMDKLAKKLESLEPGKLSLYFAPNKTTNTLLTIGTGPNSEHPLAGMANEFLDNIRAYYAAEYQEMLNQFEAL